MHVSIDYEYMYEEFCAIRANMLPHTKSRNLPNLPDMSTFDSRLERRKEWLTTVIRY